MKNTDNTRQMSESYDIYKLLSQETIDLMLERQYQQCGHRDIEVFVDNIYADKRAGGFTWGETPEGYEFWDGLIGDIYGS